MSVNVEIEGWLSKWTNYMSGYQKRWFVLSDGYLSYYKSKAEFTEESCRGGVNIFNCITTSDKESCCLIISNAGSQQIYFHLKAENEDERLKWLEAIQNSKCSTAQIANSEVHSDDSQKAPGVPDVGLDAKINNLVTCNDLVLKHSSSLLSTLCDVQMSKNSLNPDIFSNVMKQLNEATVLFRSTTCEMVNCSNKFIEASITHSKHLKEATLMERERSLKIDKRLQALVKRNSDLETALKTALIGLRVSNISEDHNLITSNSCESSDQGFEEDKEDLFVDASDVNSNIPSLPEGKDQETQLQSTNAEGGNRRTTIPYRPTVSLNLWRILKAVIGKDITKFPVPVNFNEPVSSLQMISEDMEYCSLLHRAAECTSSAEQMSYVAAFSVAAYARTKHRVGKPFNPLLGETYENDRTSDYGARVICEQVSHHPPVSALHMDSHDCTSNAGWSFWSDVGFSGSFKGNYIVAKTPGTFHVKFHASGHHYTWKKVQATVNNIIVGKMWVHNSGDAEIVNHTTGDRCKYNFAPTNYFSYEPSCKVTGIIRDASNRAQYVISGRWDEFIEVAKVLPTSVNDDKPDTLPAEKVWTINKLPEDAGKMYNFGTFTMQLNQEEEGTAPTDSRLRPDQRLTEQGEWDDANDTKLQVEDAQRKRRKAREENNETWTPRWFTKQVSPLTGEEEWVFQNQYWECKSISEWSRCPRLFEFDAENKKSFEDFI